MQLGAGFSTPVRAELLGASEAGAFSHLYSSVVPRKKCFETNAGSIGNSGTARSQALYVSQARLQGTPIAGGEYFHHSQHAPCMSLHFGRLGQGKTLASEFFNSSAQT